MTLITYQEASESTTAPLTVRVGLLAQYES